MNRLLLTLSIIFASLAAGYAFRLAAAKGHIPLTEQGIANLRKRMQMLALFLFIPVAAMLSLWGLPSPDSRLLALPLLGVVAFTVGGGLSIFAARGMGLSNRQTGSFYCCATFTNLGAVGTLVSVIFLGESTIALAALYRLCEEMYYYCISFPIAQWYGRKNEGERFSLRGLRIDPLLALVILALGIGITLNALHLPRPVWCGHLSTMCMMAGTIFLLFTIGLGLRLSRISGFLREGLAVSGIKFVCVPLVVVSLAWWLGLGQIDDGLPLKTVTILACMPVAMNALVPPSLFDLDLDLANACWIFSTLGLFAVLPILLVLLPIL